MRRVPEWKLEIQLACGDESHAEKLLMRITDWAETRRLGVGGGYHASDRRESFAFELGVCVSRDAATISEEEMLLLSRVIEEQAAIWRDEVHVSFREFTDEESDPVELERLLENVRKIVN
jgi:hypothetical protein